MGESLKQLKAINIVYRSNSFGIKRMSDLDRRRRILSRQLVLDSPSSVLQHAHLAVCSSCLFDFMGGRSGQLGISTKLIPLVDEGCPPIFSV